MPKNNSLYLMKKEKSVSFLFLATKQPYEKNRNS